MFALIHHYLLSAKKNILHIILPCLVKYSGILLRIFPLYPTATENIHTYLKIDSIDQFWHRFLLLVCNELLLS